MSLIICENCNRHRFIDMPCSHCKSDESKSSSSGLQKSAMAVLLGLSSLAIGCGGGQAMYGVPDIDADEDGYSQYEDCDDTNPDINPGAEDEEGDDIDQNCDGVDGIAEEDTGEAE